MEREQNDSIQTTQDQQSNTPRKKPWSAAERNQIRQMVRTLVVFLCVVGFTLLVMVILWNFVL